MTFRISAQATASTHWAHMGELAFANFRMTRTMGTSNVYRVLKSVLASIGAIALLTVAAAALLTYEQQQTNDDRRNEATPEDVAFVLNQAGLNPGGNFQILNSYESARPLIINDHIDGYCIKLGKL